METVKPVADLAFQEIRAELVGADGEDHHIAIENFDVNRLVRICRVPGPTGNLIMVDKIDVADSRNARPGRGECRRRGWRPGRDFGSNARDLGCDARDFGSNAGNLGCDAGDLGSNAGDLGWDAGDLFSNAETGTCLGLGYPARRALKLQAIGRAQHTHAVPARRHMCRRIMHDEAMAAVTRASLQFRSELIGANLPHQHVINHDLHIDRLIGTAAIPGPADNPLGSKFVDNTDRHHRAARLRLRAARFLGWCSRPGALDLGKSIERMEILPGLPIGQ
ncbi:MAG: hypothetical protein ABSC95_27225 [Acetobacteraceae bacterium]